MTGPKGKTLSRAVDLPGLARRGWELVEQCGGGALIGGAAVQAYGHDRATKDVDFAVSRTTAAAIERTLRDNKAESKPLKIGGLSLMTAEGAIDFIDRRHGPYALFEEAVGAAVTAATYVQADGVRVPVVPLEYLVALKMVGVRTQDEADLDFLLRRPELDYREARDVVTRHLGEVVARYLDRAARLAGRVDAPRDYEDDAS